MLSINGQCVNNGKYRKYTTLEEGFGHGMWWMDGENVICYEVRCMHVLGMPYKYTSLIFVVADESA